MSGGVNSHVHIERGVRELTAWGEARVSELGLFSVSNSGD